MVYWNKVLKKSVVYIQHGTQSIPKHK